MTHQHRYIVPFANTLQDYAASGEELNPKKIKDMCLYLVADIILYLTKAYSNI